MNWASISFDWNQIRAFLATVEEGSFSAAARALGQTQPTLSRQIASLEEALGVTLFERDRRNMQITQAGMELLDHVRAMGEAASRISLAASGQSTTVEGQVSITATDTMATLFLPSIMKTLRHEAPNITVEITAANELRDLRKREADIAIRHARPEQPDLIGKLVGETDGRMFAAKSFLDEFGRPQSPEDLANYPFVGFGEIERSLPYFAEMGVHIGVENFKISANNGQPILALTRAGLGISPVTLDVASLYPDLEEILPGRLGGIPIPIWLVTHRELNTSRRIRIVFDLLARELKKTLENAPAS
ncbi:LysR family transcriptional regulator [Maricaulis sp.]|uniref:LysR family transcriptional regulator n=1 Tax=Maricaulis sp. TaxID=1486257 RepID=UPI0026334058|nr:LysR family transcriptional regulator [Maricaulis sp.]